MLRTVKLLALVAMFLVALSASAQVTTSALSGVVTDENQQAMIGATITALHTPSGTENFTVTNRDGPNIVNINYIDYESCSNGSVEKNANDYSHDDHLLFIIYIIVQIKGNSIKRKKSTKKNKD